LAYPFVPARHFTKSGREEVDLVVVHTMEAPEKGKTAENVASWFAGSNAPQASAHYCVDADTIVQCVRDEDVAWHAPGANHDGIGIEHAGYARQSQEDWSDDYSTRMLERSAALAADLCERYRIPPVWLHPADLLAGRRGITSHANVSQAFKRSDHHDPGTSFPIQRYLRLVQQRLKDGDGGRSRQRAAPKPFKAPPPTLREGDNGWHVKRLQMLLTAAGAEPFGIDGDFGPNTTKAVRQFQAAHGLDVDGIVGAMTWKALINAA
jgi:N-acetyl-anhydromuramyl-L-alanine amidase AmpD